MGKQTKVSLSLTVNQRNLGLMYLLISLFLLPMIFTSVNALFVPPLPGAWLNFLYYSLNFFVVALIFRDFLYKSLAYAGKQFGKVIFYSLLGFFLYWAMNYALSAAIRWLLPDFSNVNDGAIADQLSTHFWPMAIGSVVLVPLTEELLHRALVFGSLYKSSPKFAYGLSMAVFASIHVMGYVGTASLPVLALCFVQYLPAGLVLAWCYRRSGCIFVPILIHTAINALGVLAMR